MHASRKATDYDSDLDEESMIQLRKAVQNHKMNNKNSSTKIAYNTGTKELKPKAVEYVVPKGYENQKKQRLKKGVPIPNTYTDYEKQGAIPKGFYREVPRYSDRVKKPEFNFNFNSRNKNVKVVNEQLCSKPFFYIVPENPFPNFFLPRGSYIVIPAYFLCSPSDRTYVRHPENSTSTVPPGYGTKYGTKLRSNFQNHPKAQGAASFSQTNNLGKKTSLSTDSHLNIGPDEVKESYITQNLRNGDNLFKKYNKSLIMFEESPEAENKSDGSHTSFSGKIRDGKLLQKTRKTEVNEDIYFPPQSSKLEGFVRDEGKLKNTQRRLMSEFPNLDRKSAKQFAMPYFKDERGLEDFIHSRHSVDKIEAQYNRMIQALPESSAAELREKAEEFGGDEDKEFAWVEAVKREKKYQQLLTEMQLILPDADPDFLFKCVNKLEGDFASAPSLIDKLLETRDYPKITTNKGKTLWLSYVKNFNVKEYISRVPNPEELGGPAGDNNKTKENLIMCFLKARYPDESETYLAKQFSLHNRNITKTCTSIVQSRTVRLSECRLDYKDLNENFLNEICYIDHKDEIDSYKKRIKEIKEIEKITARLRNAFLSCPLCSDDELISSEVVTCPEGHVFCKECIKRYIEVKMSEAIYKFVCPLENCNVFFTLESIEKLLARNVYSIVVKKQQAQELSAAGVEGLEFCPHCDFANIPDPEDRIFKCLNPSCLLETCRKCQEKNHIPLRCEEVERVADVEARKKIEEAMTAKLIRRCPNCGKGFVKIDGCNKIVCPCGATLCYLCVQKVNGYNHFRNRSGKGVCPLYSNNEDLHVREVIKAGVDAKKKLLRENPKLRILQDPTTGSFYGPP